MNSTDLIVGLDPSAYLEITGAQLAQLVNSATPQTDRGFVITTTDDGAGNPDVPDAATTARYQRYIWRRISATSVTAYTWNPAAASDVTLLKWKSIATSAIGAGAIITSMIADLAVTDSKILTVDYSKITGFPAALPPNGNAGGDLTGTYPSPTINVDAVTAAKIINSAVTTAKIADLNVTVEKLSGNGSAKDMLRTKVGSVTEMEFFTPPQIFTGLANPNNTGTDDGKLVAVNSGAAGTFKYSTIKVSAVGNVAIPAAGATAVIAHTLGVAPQQFRVVLACVGADVATAWAVGDEINIEDTGNSADGHSMFAVYIANADVTNISVLRRQAGNLQLRKKGDGTMTTVSAEGNFRLKAYSTYISL